MESCLSQERVWFDQQRYEQAEASYQKILVERHTGLCIEVRIVVCKCIILYNHVCKLISGQRNRYQR